MKRTCLPPIKVNISTPLCKDLDVVLKLVSGLYLNIYSNSKEMRALDLATNEPEKPSRHTGIRFPSRLSFFSSKSI